MTGYVINLDAATARWQHMSHAFNGSSVELVRIPAVDGNNLSLDSPDFSAAGYRWRHGREVNIFEVACYLSHLKALSTFLGASADEHALILEDDVTPEPSLGSVIQAALGLSGKWNVLRLSGLSEGRPLRIRTLPGSHSFSVNLGRLKGTGAYMINRKAARRLLDNLLPISLPYDHALDREWFWGLNAFCVLPFPISQVDRRFRSTIQHNSKPKLSARLRFSTTYPYQMFNEASRYIFRLGSFALRKTQYACGA